jgi:solute:Na+ symporter, SSS family
MRFGIFDWAVVAAVLGGLLTVGFLLKARVKSVSDFLSANRCAGRYLLCVSGGMAAFGAISFVANAEKFFQAGFGAAFWGLLLGPIGLIIAFTGWVQYRYRETRALTLAQFFEMRYSRRFRVFAGCLAWVSGIFNYGIFPGVTARFIIYFTRIPEAHWEVFGMQINITMGLVMALMLGMALFITLSAGQVAVMVTDFLQGLLYYAVFISAGMFLVFHFGWGNIISTLETAAPEGHSMLNPFDQSEVPDFNVWFFLMAATMAFYGRLAWQGTQGYYSAAKSPHESRMASILSDWRGGVMYMLAIILPISAFVLLNGGGDAAIASQAREALDSIGDSQVRNQMNTPISLSILLPGWLTALFLASICSLAISTDTTYLHSWGSIFIQDVVTPLRKEPLSLEAHLVWLRCSILGVACFGWFFSMIFPLQEYILMYFMVTGAIFTGGAGSVIIGGLYWKRGTTQAAWCALISGSILAVSGILINNIVWPRLLPLWKQEYPDVAWLVNLPERFWLNGAQLAFSTAWTCVTIYVVVSLLTCRKPFDLDRMLHRTPDSVGSHPKPKAGWKIFRMGPDFTRGDKIIFMLTLVWTGFFFLSTFTITLVNQTSPFSARFWANWWFFNVALGLSSAVVTLIWFAIGGFKNLRELLAALKKETINEEDDGRVK